MIKFYSDVSLYTSQHHKDIFYNSFSEDVVMYRTKRQNNILSCPYFAFYAGL